MCLQLPMICFGPRSSLAPCVRFDLGFFPRRHRSLSFAKNKIIIPDRCAPCNPFPATLRLKALCGIFVLSTGIADCCAHDGQPRDSPRQSLPCCSCCFWISPAVQPHELILSSDARTC